jgi:hypothetical protein
MKAAVFLAIFLQRELLLYLSLRIEKEYCMEKSENFFVLFFMSLPVSVTVRF